MRGFWARAKTGALVLPLSISPQNPQHLPQFRHNGRIESPEALLSNPSSSFPLFLLQIRHFQIFCFVFLPSPSSSKKVSDRIVKLFAIDPYGKKHEVVGLSGQTLLKALTNTGLIDPESHRLEEIDACSAECEVNIAEEWLEKLPPRSYDEEYVLKRNARSRILNKHSRLGCQVVLTPELQGMVVAVPEPRPWDIP